jgi:hypothetical protein
VNWVSDPPPDKVVPVVDVMVAVPPRVDAEADAPAYKDNAPPTIRIPALARIPIINRRARLLMVVVSDFRIVLTRFLGPSVMTMSLTVFAYRGDTTGPWPSSFAPVDLHQHGPERRP